MRDGGEEPETGIEELGPTAAAPGRERSDKTTGRWRLGGIVSRPELFEWLRIGVFDAHIAGALKTAGITPDDLDGLVDETGNAIAPMLSSGKISCVRAIDLAVQARAKRTR